MQTARIRGRSRVLASSAVASTALAVALLPGPPGSGAPASAASDPAGADQRTARAAAGPYVTFLFSRTEITAADDCVVANAGVARLDTAVAPYLSARGFSGTGSLATGRTSANALTCVHYRSSMAASWNQARSLAADHGWSFVSHTATYPGNLSSLSPARAEAETCGSARAIDAQGLPGGHGLIAYPGAQGLPTAVHAEYGARCFAWGRQYGGNGLTTTAAASTAPYWQRTLATNGGPCNLRGRPCYSIQATGSKRYNLPSKFTTVIGGLDAGEWFTLQSYVLVTGRSPAYASSDVAWDCTAADPRLHWTNDNERYCYSDWQRIVAAVDALPAAKVTDPLTVGVAFGRPASYP